MIRPFHVLAAMLALAPLAENALAQERRVDYPRLCAALHELRDARAGLVDAKDSWPPGQKEQALTYTNDAINSIANVLAVKDVTIFRGVERTPDYYTRYPNHPRLRAALADLREARTELQAAKADVGGLKERALDDIDVAVGSIIILIRYQPPR